MPGKPSGQRDPDVRESLVALGPRLRRFAYGLTGSADEADDLVQSAYERALSRIDQWQPGTRLDSWMYRITQSIWFNRWESQKRRKRHITTLASTAEAEQRGDEQFEHQLTLDRVRGFVSTLPEEQRIVLLLIAVEGFSYQEASDMLGIPVGTITSRLGRARSAIREFIAGPTLALDKAQGSG